MTEAVVPTRFNRIDALKDVQGGLIGFNKDHMVLLSVNLADAATGRALVAELLPQLASGYEVLHFNDLYGEIRKRGGNPERSIQATWTNLLLTQSGLQMLGAPGLDALPEEFRAGMANRVLGDINASAPPNWVPPFTGGAEPHMIIEIASDTAEDLTTTRAWVEALLGTHGATLLAAQAGDTRPGALAGHEHFGFKDGISQPGIDHFTKSSKSGSIPAGEVLIGYKNADGEISGQPSPVPAPAPTAYDPTTVSPLPMPLPGWLHNGSFVVLRRLRQDVAAFLAATAGQASGVGLTADQLAAKIVGRWRSGAPMERVPGMPPDLDPSVGDPSVSCPFVLESDKINKFDFHDDVDGTRVPRAAHVRKMNPRANVLADNDRSGRHRMVRRGITYGPEFAPGESPYGQIVPDTQDRGLLFINYQSSIARTFEFVQTKWANREDFQQPGDGRDPIISQDVDQRPFNLPPGHAMSFAPWVITTGGAYLVSPSLSGLAELSQPVTATPAV